MLWLFFASDVYCVCVCVADVSPMSAPGFSFCFPLLQAVLSQSSGASEETELMLTRALQTIHTHAQLHSSSSVEDTLIDEVFLPAGSHVFVVY